MDTYTLHQAMVTFEDLGHGNEQNVLLNQNNSALGWELQGKNEWTLLQSTVI